MAGADLTTQMPPSEDVTSTQGLFGLKFKNNSNMFRELVKINDS
jgi:hypothetical protein